MSPLSAERLVARAEEELRARRDPAAAGPMAAYMKTDQPFFGVKAKPRKEVLRILAKEFAPETFDDYERAIRALHARPERETQYLALDYGERFKKFIVLDALDLYETLIRTGGWWDLVDGVAVNLVGGVLAKHRAEVTPIMRAWIDDDDMWIRRTAIICQNRHRADTDAELLFEFCLARMHETEFFIRKAIGWALREYSYAEPEAVRAFLLEHQDSMSGLSFREGAKQLRRTGLIE